MKKMMFIVNPVAGRMTYKQGFGEALRILSEGGYLPTVFFTTRKGDALKFAEEAADYDLVCCLGGDGTLSEVAAGLMSLKTPPPIGYFPLGTANDVATTLGLPKNDPIAAAQIVLEGRPTTWDLGKIGRNKFFVYVAAFGAFTDVSYETPQQSKQTFGHLAYVIEGISRLPNLPKYKTRVILDDREELSGDFIFGGLTNSTSVAGLVKMDKNLVRLDDGKFEVVLVKNPPTIVELNLLMSEVITQKYDGDFFKILQASKVRFIFEDSVSWTRDGEKGGMFKDVTIENIQNAVQIIA